MPGQSRTSIDEQRSHDIRPDLKRDRSFWAMAATQFLGAFNDNVFKQLILLLATPSAAAIAKGAPPVDLQSRAQYVFAAAFLLFSGFAGYLSDKFSKRRIVVIAKMAEIFIMLLGMIGFMNYSRIGVTGMFVVLFLMGTHSAFFGPSKYGILPEMIREADLPRANGIFLMLTFLAIIFGVALAGGLLLLFTDRVWLASLACIAIAVMGTMTALSVRPLPAANPNLEYRWSCWLISKDTLKVLLRDRELWSAMAVVAIFWMVGGMVLQSVNALGRTQLGLNEFTTSLLAASIGIGTAIGCMLGGYLSRGRVNTSIVVIGTFGTVITLGLMSLPGGEHGHLLGFYGSIPVLILLGTFSGMFIVPVQVTLQSRPPRDEKGRMIATMNQISWIGVILGAIVFEICLEVLKHTGGQRSLIFAATAILMLPVAILYRPKDVPLPDRIA